MQLVWVVVFVYIRRMRRYTSSPFMQVALVLLALRGKAQKGFSSWFIVLYSY